MCHLPLNRCVCLSLLALPLDLYMPKLAFRPWQISNVLAASSSCCFSHGLCHDTRIQRGVPGCPHPPQVGGMAWVLSFPYFPGKSSRQRFPLCFCKSSKVPCPDMQWLALILLNVGTAPSSHLDTWNCSNRNSVFQLCYTTFPQAGK